MAEKNLNNIRIVNKHDTEENWLKATGFTPKQGELIVYDIDENYNYERIKIGDGIQNVNDLHFVDDALRADLVARINDVDDKVDAVSALIGDESVSEQINVALESHEVSWNDLNDRPFYKEPGEYITIIEEQTVTNGSTVTGEALRTGKTYIMTVNGVDYTCKSSYLIESGTTYISISDPYVMVESNDGLTVKTSGDSVVLSVKIQGEDTIVPIPDEYLPSTVVKSVDGTLPNSSGMVRLLESKSFYIDRDYTGTSMRDILNQLSAESYRCKGYVYNNLQENSNAYQGLVIYADTYGGLDYTHRFILLNKLGGIKVFLVDTDADTININGGVGAVEIQGDLASTSYVDSAIAAIPTPDVSGQIEAHNTNETAHSDIRTAISDVSALVGDIAVSEQINAAAVNNQSDWSVNDETSPAYVKNRTHWVSTEYVTFIDNETVEFFDSDGAYIAEYQDDDIVFINGNTYTFVIDGTSYNCVANIFEDYGYTYIGNLGLLDPSFEDTLEPFYIFCYNESEISTMGLVRAGLMIATTLEGDSHVISLSGFNIVCHKIDKIYLPYLAGQEGSGEGAEIFNDYSGENVASGGYSHAEGQYTTASGWTSHAEGSNTTASSSYSHAEGNATTASGTSSHAEGNSTTASGYISHAEGYQSVASGDYGSHAEGYLATASGNNSHAEGYNTTASSQSQHVQGQYNIIDTSGSTEVRGKYAHIVGNGTSSTDRSNAHTLDWAGNAWFKGTVKICGTGQDDEAAKELATQEYVKSFLPKSATITLPAANWTGDANPWSQVVTINGVTANSKVDLQPTAVQIVELQNNDIALMAENDDGVITVYAIGSKPTVDYTMQVLITEVVVV